MHGILLFLENLHLIKVQSIFTEVYAPMYILRIRPDVIICVFYVDCLKDLNIEYHLPRGHRSNRGVKRKKQNVHPFIVASFNAQSVKGNDVACKRCEISTLIKDNSVDLFYATETWLSAHGEKEKTVELAPSGFGVKSFPRQSRSRGGGIATVYKSTLGTSIILECIDT